VANEKERKKETSAVKYNTSGHYRGRRYKYGERTQLLSVVHSRGGATVTNYATAPICAALSLYCATRLDGMRKMHFHVRFTFS